MAAPKRDARAGLARGKRHPRVLVIYKKSTYQVMVGERKNPRARALLERKDRSVERMLASHEDHVNTIAETRALLMPAHFAPPHAAYIKARGDAFELDWDRG